ncbi:MAG: hypothetical protein COV48_13745 [Elusimicrobia bacterium CG11_big_fil_rev_8_21_14_0_20_64_6]|nr:MAG: hypothetical protein COV48_13745 [Elusimicrobia bacterium CG11_big_fil_rev_8_21_14_0_20_64_6]
MPAPSNLDKTLRRLWPLAALLLLAACSRKTAQNYRHCLKLRVGMTREQAVAVMGQPEEITPYVEGKSLPHLKGLTAYEWRNPGSMPAPNHITIDDATGKVRNIRCGDSTVNTAYLAEPEAGPAAEANAPAAAAPSPANHNFSANIVISIGAGQPARLVTVALGVGKFQFQSGWKEGAGERLIEFNGNVLAGPQEGSDIEYELRYSINPPDGEPTEMKTAGRITLPLTGEVALGETQDGTVKLAPAGEDQ